MTYSVGIGMQSCGQIVFAEIIEYLKVIEIA